MPSRETKKSEPTGIFCRTIEPTGALGKKKANLQQRRVTHHSGFLVLFSPAPCMRMNLVQRPPAECPTLGGPCLFWACCALLALNAPTTRYASNNSSNPGAFLRMVGSAQHTPAQRVPPWPPSRRPQTPPPVIATPGSCKHGVHTLSRIASRETDTCKADRSVMKQRRNVAAACAGTRKDRHGTFALFAWPRVTVEAIL